MPTARSWSSRGPGRRAVADLWPLLQLRTATVRGRGRLGVRIGFGVILGLSVAAAWLPAYLQNPRVSQRDVLLVLPTGCVSVLLISIVSAAASGGGRELLQREHAVAFPVSPTTDHLGALLLAPLNIAWLLQSWTLLAATAYAVGPRPTLPAAELPVLLWLAAGTATAQLAAWSVEWVRRGPHGRLLVWLGTGVLAMVFGWLLVSDKLVRLLDHSPTIRVTLAVLQGADGQWLPWLRALAGLALITAASVLLGGYVNEAVARRPARDEARAESSVQVACANPASDLAAVLRVDRASIWRSVPLRRGLAVLALLPGLVAVASALHWNTICLLPGLVASGGALLFGVNAWCLDGRGALWRDSLPVPPRLAFVARAVVLAEVLVMAIALTLAMAVLRAGAPTPAEAVAVACSAVVVTLQVVSAALRWSVRRPFPVDLRSARATPAPPLVMVGYSSRLALATTTTGLLFSAAAMAPGPWAPVLAVPLLSISLLRLRRTARHWADPTVRCRVVATVAS